MGLFQKNKRYRTIAVHVFFCCAIAVLGVLLLFRFDSLLGLLKRLFVTLSPVLYGLLFAYFCLPILRFYEDRVFRRLHLEKMTVAQETLRKHSSDEFRNDPERRKARRAIHHYRIHRRALSISLTYLTILLFFVIFGLIVVPQIANEYTQLSTKLSDYVNGIIQWLQGHYILISESFDINSLITMLRSFLADLLFGTANLLSGIILVPYRILLGFAVSFYILLRKERVARKTKRLVAAIFPRKLLARISEVTKYADKTFGRYLIGKVFEALIVGALFFFVLMIFRFPYFSLVAIIMMITNLIPVFGVYIGCVPSAVLICIENPVLALWFLMLTFVITQLDGALIGPKVIGSAIGLDGLWIIISITVAGAFFGIPGMLFGAPIFSILFSAIRNLINRRLAKKGYDTASSEFSDMFSTENILPTRQTRRLLKKMMKRHAFSEDEAQGGDEE